MKKIVLVTGANRGLGLETVLQMLLLDYTVILTSRNAEKGKKAYASLKEKFANTYFHQMDVSSISSVQECFEYVKAEHGQLDILINNAAINYDTWQNVLNANLEECKTTLDINIFGPWRVVKIFAPLLNKSSFGRIVNVSSGSGSLNNGESGAPGYSISKAGLNMLTKKMANVLSPKGVLVNAVCPGWVRTDMGGPNATRPLGEGAKGIVWAATLPNDGPTGGFFRDGQKIAW
jgi:NAD(P)-dependent dehydrogenase (short-subunit alcohol dehydrogenase family)